MTPRLRVPRTLARLTRSFATEASRFRLAVSMGFVVAAAAFLVIGVGTRFGTADSIWGAIEIPGLTGPMQAPAPTYAESSAQYAPRARHRPRLARRRASELTHDARFEPPHDGPTNLARRSVCVRLCDGFVFPVGDYHGSGDRVAHEATCQSQCPGAKTSLFVLPRGAESISEATEVKTGRSYGELPDAFHYATYLQDSCSCGAHGNDRVRSLLRDFTLRRGDTIMTPRGMQVFHGGKGFPFKRKDFVALKKSRDVRKGTLASLRAMERASLAAPIIIAPPVATASATPARRPRRLIQQARN